MKPFHRNCNFLTCREIRMLLLLGLPCASASPRHLRQAALRASPSGYRRGNPSNRMSADIQPPVAVHTHNPSLSMSLQWHMILTPSFGTYPDCVELYRAAPVSFGLQGMTTYAAHLTAHKTPQLLT